jgi:hypothetical protein
MVIGVLAGAVPTALLLLMISPRSFPMVTSILGLGGGVILLLIPGSRRKERPAGMVHVLLRIAGSMALSWGFVGLVRVYGSAHFSVTVQEFLKRLQTVIGGIAIGVWLMLVISLELFMRARRTNTNDRPN